jgi:catechol 2,3-dioxygenase-like lactoylglutathione lyase family enzyme
VRAQLLPPDFSETCHWLPTFLRRLQLHRFLENYMNCYVTLGALDHVKSSAFFDETLGTIGWAKHSEFPGWRAYSEGGSGNGLVVWVCKPFNGQAASAGNGTMVAFAAKSRAQVDAFYAAAMANGGSDEGAPGPRPDYGPKWYATYLRDPTGNKLAVVFND